MTPPVFLYKTGKEMHSVKTSEIAYLKNVKRVIELYVWDHYENSVILASKFYSTVSDAMSQLPSSQFLRCERSHIINMGYTQLMEKNGFTLKDKENTRIPISRSCRADARKAFFAQQETN
jgi:DNA-binding LytR/AlgR family response regulator